VYILGASTTADNTFTLSTVLSVLAPAFVFIAIGIFLFDRTERLAMLITPPPAEEQLSMQYDMQYLQSILFSVVGVFIFATSIPKFFQTISGLITFNQNDYPTNPVTPKIVRDTWFALTGGVVQLIIGIALFFRGKKLSSWWHRMREWNPKP
jgi:uncharacterized membrane protein